MSFPPSVGKNILTSPGAHPQLRKQLGLDKLEGVNWHIEGAVATTGTGLFEGLDWLVENLPDEKEAKKKHKAEAKEEKEAH